MSTPPNITEVADRFALVAQEFCDAIDSAPNLEKMELLARVYRILPKLIGEAICLPDVELSDDESGKRRTRNRLVLGNAQWNQLYESLREKLGDTDLYWQVFDPTKDNEAIRGTLADDFADIYGDLKEGLNLRDAHQAPPEDNIWHWRFHYYSHWGKHAMDALRTIHFLLEDTLS